MSCHEFLISNISLFTKRILYSGTSTHYRNYMKTTDTYNTLLVYSWPLFFVNMNMNLYSRNLDIIIMFTIRSNPPDNGHCKTGKLITTMLQKISYMFDLQSSQCVGTMHDVYYD